jgi:hypothetical protein
MELACMQINANPGSRDLRAQAKKLMVRMFAHDQRIIVLIL